MKMPPSWNSLIAGIAAFLALHFLLPERARKWTLLSAGLVFYGATEPRWIPILLFQIACTYGASLRAQKSGRAEFAVAIALLLSPLLLTKYFGISWWSASLLPLGISFLTFQMIGYLVDVRSGRIQAERDFPRVALFSSFLPLQTAGPIERADRLMPQLQSLPGFEYERFRAGILLICLGVFKKWVIAESLWVWISAVYSEPEKHSGWSLYLATILSRYQIFADLSGYTDIASGIGWVVGIRLMQNFNCPFAATHVADHWRRWHISLSSWIRDYLYYPLIASRFGRLGVHIHLLVTFLILGLWHGGTWNFAVYGLIQGILVVGHDLSASVRHRFWTRVGVTRVPWLKGLIEVLSTFAIWVALPTVFFRARSLEESGFILWRILTDLVTRLPGKADAFFLTTERAGIWPWILLCVISYEILQWIHTRLSLTDWLKRQAWEVRWIIYSFALVVALLLGRWDSGFDFVYRHF